MDGFHNEAFSSEHARENSVGPMWANGNLDGEERVRRAPPLGSSVVDREDDQVDFAQPVFRSVAIPQPPSSLSSFSHLNIGVGGMGCTGALTSERLCIDGRLPSALAPPAPKRTEAAPAGSASATSSKVTPSDESQAAYGVPTLDKDSFLQPNTISRFSTDRKPQEVAALIHKCLSGPLKYGVRAQPAQARWYCTRASSFGFAEFVVCLHLESSGGSDYVLEVQRRRGDGAEVASARAEIARAIDQGGVDVSRVTSSMARPLEITMDMAEELGMDGTAAICDGFQMLMDLEASAAYLEVKVDVMRSIANRTEEAGACDALCGTDVLRALSERLVAALQDEDSRITSYAAHALANICEVEACRRSVIAAGVLGALSGWAHPVPSVHECGLGIREACEL